jgi:hypothetical protein
MPKRTPRGNQIDTIARPGDLFQPSFNLDKQDQFVTGLGVAFRHYKAMPSVLGLKDRGDYRRPDALDENTSNGMTYSEAGCFTATLVGNSNSKSWGDSGLLDNSTARLIMPRFYDTGSGVADGDRIYMQVGDRVYIKDQDADVLVANYHRMDYVPGVPNRPMFPIEKIESVKDSRGLDYQEGVDFCITADGDISWLSSGSNPGIDPETRAGRVYAVRYLYRAFWYVVSIPNEIRISNVTDGGSRAPQRMPYHAVVQREYVYHNRVNAPKASDAPPAADNRVAQKPEAQIGPTQAQPPIKVNVADFESE